MMEFVTFCLFSVGMASGIVIGYHISRSEMLTDEQKQKAKESGK